MKSKAAMTMQIVLLIPLAAFFFALRAEAGGEPVATQTELPQLTPQAPGSQETLRVSEGKSFVVNSAEAIKRVSVTNDQIATAIVISPNQVLIHGLKAGTVSFLLWNEQEQVRAFDLQVLAVPMNLEPLRATLSRVFPGQDIRVSQSGSSVVLTGTVASAAIADQVASIARTEAGNVVSLLAATPLANQIVMLEVKFAEVDRSAVQQLGANILSTGAANTLGAVSTQQFSPPSAPSLASAIGTPVQGFPSTFNLTSLLNIFVFRPDLNLGVLIQALQQKSLLQTLAEPNLLAIGGKEASFLAGGEFPVPIIQGTTGTPTVSVQYKEYGVRLKFVANPNPDGTITLHVAPEVSELDYTNAVTLSGFLIPALTTRRAETEVQLKDGQSFAIAGLLDNRVSKITSKIPGLGDLPILGKLFQSTNFTKSKTELLVMISPHLVRPLDPGQIPPLPSYPVPFLNPDKFDGKSGQTPAIKPAKQPG